MPQFVSRRTRGVLALSGVIVGTAFLVGARAQAPTNVERYTAQLVVDQLQKHHLAHPVLDDELAKKWARNYIDMLDPQKVYFEKGDVETLLKRDTLIDDEVRKGNIDFAREVYDLFLKRHDERLATIKAYLGKLEKESEAEKKAEFAVDETMVDDPKLQDFPANAEEATDRWRKRLKLDILQLKLAKTDEADIYKQLNVRYRDRNRMWHQFDTNDLLEVYLTALTTVLDPHTSYMGKNQLEDLMGQTLHLSLDGIGASLSTEDGYATVKEIVAGGAADKDGRLQPEDKIVGIKKDDGEVDDLVEKKLADVVRKIRGPRGTKIRLIVQPADSKDRKEIELTRQKIELKDSHARSQILESKGPDGKDLKIGIIDLPSFYGDSDAIRKGDPNAVSATLDCKKFLTEFKEKGVDAVVLDLRRNGGGLLPEAITLSGLFIDHGPVVQVRDPTGVKPALEDDDEGTAWDGPLALLISHQSASASEIFAGVIKDYKRGLIIGDSSTFGKGTVQSIVLLNEQLTRGDQLPNLGALKLTIQQFFRANGESTQIQGVPPDIHIPSLLDQIDLSEGKMDHALKFDKIAALPHDNYNRVPADLVAQLNARSEERRKASPKFQKQVESMKKLADRKARHAISLNEEKFKAEVIDDEDDLDEAKPKGKDKAKKRHSDQPPWDTKDFYNEEVIAIVKDYLTLGTKALAAAPVRVEQP